MAYREAVTNADGELIGYDYHYDDAPEPDDDFGPDYDDGDYADDDSRNPDYDAEDIDTYGLPESDLGWLSDVYDGYGPEEYEPSPYNGDYSEE